MNLLFVRPFLFLAAAAAGLGFADRAGADWTAFNDQGPTGNANDTAYTFSALGTAGGALKNITNGASLSAVLTITNNAGSVTGAGTMSAPPAGTPAYTYFTPYIDWTTTPTPGVEVFATNTFGYVFSGLDLSKRYRFIATSARGGDITAASSGYYYSNRWTRAELVGAASYTVAHSAGIITSNQFPADLTGNQAAWQSGVNTTNLAGQNTGDVIAWDNIVPAPDGTFTVLVTRYTGHFPGSGTSTADAAYGYTISALRLDEFTAGGPPQITASLQNQTNAVGSAVTFTIGAAGTAPLAYYWSSNGTFVLASSTNSFTSAPLVAGSNFLCTVIVSNALGTATSSASAWGVASIPTVTLNMPTNNQSFAVPATVILQATASGGVGGSVTGVGFFTTNNGWIASVLTSPYSNRVTVTVTNTYGVYAVVTNNFGFTTYSATNRIVVSGNLAPTISITAPANSTVFDITTNIAITVSAADTDGTVTNVAFYMNGSWIGANTKSPFGFNWSTVTPGTYALTAVATDNGGINTTSAAVSVSVVVWPTNDNFSNRILLTGTATFAMGTTIGATKEAGEPAQFGGGDSSHSIWYTWIAPVTGMAKATVSSTPIWPWPSVSVFTGNTVSSLALVASGNAAVATWNAVGGTTYQIGVDALYAGTGPMMTQVNMTNCPPSVAITNLVNGASFAAPATVTIAAQAAAFGSITNVSFYSGTGKIGESTTSPYSYTASGVAAGIYTLTAVATDNAGLKATSAPVRIAILPAGNWVGAGGYTNDFSTQPTAAQWSTMNPGGTTASITAAAGLDAAALTNVASAMTTALPSDTGNPPTQNALAVWSTAGYVQTSPNSVAYTPLLATFVNNSGTDAAGIRIRYTFTTNSTTGENIQGQRVYYSLTGLAGSWTLIPALCSQPGGILDVTVTLSAPWTYGSRLYLLWMDDNSSGTDMICQIDNFNLNAIVFPVAAFTAQPPVLDGVVDAVWNNAPVYSISNITVGATNVSGPADLSATWRCLWDTNYLYLLVSVTDDTLNNDSANPWDDDALEIFIDSNNSKTTTYGASDFQYLFGWNDTTVIEYDHSPASTNGVIFAQATVAGGYVMEIRFPWTNFSLVPAVGKRIGFEIEVDDDDNGGTRDSKMDWWVRNGDAASSNPSLFGVLELASNSAPVYSVTITSPANNAIFTTQDTIPITASATNSSGTVTKVDFYAGSTLLGTASNSPFVFNWSGATVGSYALTAVATTSGGTSVTSAPVNITVNLYVSAWGGLDFNGTSQYVTFGAAPGLDAATFTLETWFKWRGYGAVASTGAGGVSAIPLVTKGRGESESATYNANYFLGIRADGVLAADMEEGPGGTQVGLNHPIIGVTPITTNVWHHAAVTYDGANWALYLDGNLETSLYVGQPPAYDSIQHAALGTALDSSGTPQGFFAGVLDEARIWNYARSAVQVAGTMNWEIVAASGLLGRWSLNETNGSIASDSSGQAVDGALVSAPAWTSGYPGFVSLPTVVITNPTNGASFGAPATIPITASASSSSGTITNVQFYAGSTFLGHRAASPYAITWSNVVAGDYVLTAVAVDGGGLRATSAPVSITVGLLAGSQWVAFNDQQQGPNSSPRDTFYTVATVGTSAGPLSNIVSGAGLSAALTITNTSDVIAAGTMSAPLAGTPAADIFGAYIDWNGGSGSANGLHIYSGGAIGYTFTGLNPDRTYKFTASSVRGGTTQVTGNEYSNRWLQAELIGPSTWKANHSFGIITSNDFPGDLTGNQAAFNAGINTNGLVVQWDNIVPAANGTFTVLTKQYLGAFPSGSGANALYTFAFSALRLEEFFAGTAVAVTGPTNGTLLITPTNVTLTASASSSSSLTNVGFYANGALVDQVMNSPYRVTWSNPAPGAYQLTAVAWDADGNTVTSAVVNVTVATNDVPFVTMTSPADGASAFAPASFALSVTATDLVGVARVEFYHDGAKLGQATNAPYTLAWSGVTAGLYQLWAVATDNLGLAGTSAVVNVTVTNNLPPVVSLTSPTNGASFSNAPTLALTATATDVDDAVVKVEFYDGAAKLGESLTGPLYSLTWSNAGAGLHALLAVATDSVGLKGTSAPVSITVLGNQAPTVAITNPVNGTGFSAPANFALSATAADSDGTVTNVSFYAGTTLLGGVTAVPYTMFWTNVAAGSYTLTAVASDNGGLRSTSAPVNITVTSPSVPLLISYDFSTLPAASNWSTYAIPGAAGTLTTSAQLDAVVQTLTASLITAQLSGTNVNPPAASGPASWSSTGGYVQTRPTGVDATALMCMLLNGSGGALWALDIAYDYATPASTTNSVAEELPGHLVYYSLTGLANSWVPIPTLTLQPAGHLSTVLNLASSWSNGTALYLLWADDNGSGSPDWALQIDNFLVTDDNRPRVQLTSPTNNALVVLPASLVLSANVSGFTNSVVTNVVFYSGAARLGDTPVAPYSFTWSTVTPGSYTLTAVARDSAGLAVTSAPVAITVMSNVPPVVAITSPADSTLFSAPTDVPITVTASDSADGGRVTNVVYYANGVKIGENANTPFAFTWLNPATNAYSLTAVAYDDHGAPATSAVVRVYVIQSSAPTVVSFAPPSGSVVSSLSAVTVTFDQPVNGVDADDLLVNNVPATGVAGSGAVYTFSFAPPAEGLALLTWAPGQGIVNQEPSPKAFDGTWTNTWARYTYLDTIAPTLASLSPAPGATLPSFTTLTVAFSEAVRGVDASALLVNGVAATKVTGAGAGPYVFEFAPPLAGPVTVAWAAGQGIHDLALTSNSFVAGSPWTYTLAPALAESAVVINEIYFAPPSGNEAEAWLELFNNGGTALDLTGWSFSHGPGYTFPAVTLPAGGYLVVAADVPTFTARHPGVTNVVGGWTGSLKSHLTLVDAAGNVANDLTYAKGGDWGERLLGSGESPAMQVTRSGSTVTVVMGNYMTSGDTAIISGADQPEYNGTFTVANCTMSGFTYTISGTPATPATSTNSGALIVREMTDWGQVGWCWGSRADGLGASLELLNPNLPNQYGQNWRSVTPNGTPGRANTGVTNNVAPLILNVAHYPLVPRSTNAITITAQILDEHATGVTATLWWRLDAQSGSLPFSSTNLLDDGQHGDGAAGDGAFGAVLPPQTNNAIVEFYVTATDAEGHTRQWPAAPLDGSRLPLAAASVPNALLQVDNNPANDYSPTNGFPIYRLIMRQADATNYNVFPSKAPNSDARQCVTWIATDGTGAQAIYLSEVRDRGNGTRSRTPPNYRVAWPADHAWHNLNSLELNSQYTESQLAGYALCLQAGTYAEWGRAAKVRINNVDRTGSGSPQFGVYIQLTPLDGNFPADHFPKDPGGNLYRAQGRGVLGEPLHGCSITNTSTNWTGFANLGFSQQTGNGDWSDLTYLGAALATNTADDATYVAAIRRVIDVDEWMRSIAWFSLTVSMETSLQATGVGDDYTLYRGVQDTRFRLVAHDLDTILNEGDTAASTTASLWRMVPFIMGTTNGNPGPNCVWMNRFMVHPQFVPSYFRELYQQATTVFAPGPLSAVLQSTLGSFVPQATINNMVSFGTNRANYVLSQIPLTLTASSGLSLNNGYYYTTTPTLTLSGQANAIDTRSVTVNGAASAWLAWQARWTNTLTLQPGINRLLIEARDSNNVVFASTNLDVWYNSGGGTTVGGTMASDTVWTAAGGPYTVSSTVTIPSGVTLTIQPGTTLYLGSGVSLTVANGGRLLAEGTAAARIRCTVTPGSGVSWGGITINGAVGSPETRLAYIDFQGAAGVPGGEGNACIEVNGGTLYLDHANFLTTTIQYVSLDSSSFLISSCIFPTCTLAAGFELLHGTGGIKAGGRGIVRECYFGTTTNYNDIMDFTGGNRDEGQPIVQYYNNVFTGGSDDQLDLDGTDAWIEGNIFLHSHRNGSPDSSSSISGGNYDFGGSEGVRTSQITIIGNLFFDDDNAATAKEGNFFTLLNNTIVHITKTGGMDYTSGVVNEWDIANSGAGAATGQGVGFYLEGNIIWDVENLVRNYDPTNGPIVFNNNLLPSSWTGPGANNTVANPQLTYVPQVSETFFKTWQDAQVMWKWFAPQAGSPALGTGSNGRDKGGVIPYGVSLAGPVGLVHSNTATIIVGTVISGGNIPTNGFPNGSGFTAYQYQLDNGAWLGPVSTLTPLTLSNQANGPHRVAVVGLNDAGYYQNNPALGPDAVVSTLAWYVDTNAFAVRLNEVLAANETAVPVNGRYPDLVELYNAGATVADLSGLSLSDDPADPQKFVFPAGASIVAGQYLVLYADSASTPAGYHLGFALNQDGESVTLYDAGGRTLDTVAFGPQAPDYSIGRLADGAWALCVPSFGAANVAAVTGDPTKLKINEWLANAVDVYASDFLEIYNADTRPVRLGGLYLTDVPTGAPDQHQIAALSFIAGSGYVVFQPDGNPDQGPTHLDFKLNPDRGEIGLFNTNLTLLDYVLYGPQRTDVSQGRSPNGSTNLVFFTTATPGSPNPAPAAPVGTQIVLNEVLVKNYTGLTNADGGTPSWIEIYNPTPSVVDLSDLSLATNAASPRAFVFPAGTTLPVGGYLVVTFDPSLPATTNVAARPNTGFGLKDNGGSVYLYDRLASGGSLLDSLAYGVQANDYSVGRYPNGGTNWTLTLPTPGSVNLAATPGNPALIRVNEWMASNPNGSDWFELYNPNTQPVSLTGLYLTDDLSTPATRQKFPLAPLSYLGEGAYAYQRFWADKTPSAGPEHLNFKLKSSGGVIALYGPADAQIDAVTYGAQTSGVSQGRLPDGAATIVFFPTTATPSDANYLPLPSVVINEVLPAIPAGAPLEQAIELLNTGAAAVDLSGWWLSNQKHTLQKYQFPAGTTLPAGGYVVAYAWQLTGDIDPVHRLVLDGFNGDQLYLSAADPSGTLTGYRADQSFGPAAPGVSFGRYTNSVASVDFTALSATTFGHDAPDGVADFRLGTGAANAYPLVGPVVISEIMYHPPDLGGTNNLRDEFIELHNPSASPVALFDLANPTNTWHIRGGLSYDFPTNLTLAAGGYLLVVSFDPAAPLTLASFRAAYPTLATNAALYGPYSGALGNNGDTIELNRPGTPVAGVVPRYLVEHVQYNQSAPWPIAANGLGFSLQRLSETGYGNDPTNWFAAVPTPGPQTPNADSDGDGIPDWWTQLYFGHPTGQAGDLSRAQDDPDHDGLTNLQEYWAGTNPTNAASVLRLATDSGATTGGSNAVFSFPGVAAQSYTVQYSDTLPLGWINLLSLDPLPADGPIWITNQVPAVVTQRFYRVVTPRLP